MTLREKRMKVAIIVASCLQHESDEFDFGDWGKIGRNVMMNGREITQRKCGNPRKKIW